MENKTSNYRDSIQLQSKSFYLYQKFLRTLYDEQSQACWFLKYQTYQRIFWSSSSLF